MQEDQLRQLIDKGIEKGRRYGIVIERDVAKLLDLMVALHPDFDSGSDTAWARDILMRYDLPAGVRLDKIFRALSVQSRKADLL